MTARPRTREESTLAVVPEQQDVAVDVEALREQIRQELLAELAQDARVVEEAPEDPTAPRIIHILSDGFTAFGKVWYRGQEITVVPDSDEWKATVDTQGLSWLNLSAQDQEIRYGRQVFGRGHWPYGGFDLTDPALSEEDREILARAEQKRKQRAATPGVSFNK